MAQTFTITEQTRGGRVVSPTHAVPQVLRGKLIEWRIVSADWDAGSPWTLDCLVERSQDNEATWQPGGQTTFISGRRTKSGALPSMKFETMADTTDIRLTFDPSRAGISIGFSITIQDVGPRG